MTEKFDFTVHVEVELKGDITRAEVEDFLDDVIRLSDPDDKMVFPNGAAPVVTWEVESTPPRPTPLDVLSQARRTPHSGSQRPTSDEQNPSYRQAMMDSGRGHLLP